MDLATFITVLLGALATVIVGGAAPLAVKWFVTKGVEQDLILAQRRLVLAQFEAQVRADIDAGAQKALGAAIATHAPDGKLTDANREQIIVAAATTLQKNFPQKFADLGIVNVEGKAKEVITRTVGLMDAQAAGNPVINPSQQTVVIERPTPGSL